MGAEGPLAGTACLAALVALGCAASPSVPSQAQSADRGARLFQQCYACHSVTAGETGLSGPNLAGVVGRPMAADPTFADYSPALRQAGGAGRVWSEAELHRYLSDPEAALPGTAMGYVGMRDARDRAVLIAWLRRGQP